MGAWFCKRALPDRIIIAGLDAVGKTQLVYKLKLGETISTIPTVGINIEKLCVDGVDILCYDVGGGDNLRPIVEKYYRGGRVNGTVYVIDSSDRARLSQSLEELYTFNLAEKDSYGSVVMILANKQDIPGCLSQQEVEDAFRQKYPNPLNHHTVFVSACSARTGAGILEAFHTFLSQIHLMNSGNCQPAGFIHLPDPSNRETESMFDFKFLFRDPFNYLKSLLLY